MTVDESVLDIFADILDVDQSRLHLRARPEDFPEWDSIATVNIIVALEDEFDKKFKLEEIQNLKSIADFVELIRAT